MTNEIKAALESLFNAIIEFVKAIFAKEVGDEIKNELEDAWSDVAGK